MSKPKANGAAPLTDVAAIEQALLSIPGMRGARILIGEDGGIGEVHAVASPQRSAKKIVRDIESFLVVRYGYRIDYRRISLVQLGNQGLPERVNLLRVDHVQQSDGSYIEVELRKGEQTFYGRAMLGNDPMDAAAHATVAALNTLLGPHTPLQLGGIQTTTVGAHTVVVACIMHCATTLEQVLGTTFVRSSVAESAARAVLAATNRRLVGWLIDQQDMAAFDVAVV
jgi:hypothetical protein